MHRERETERGLERGERDFNCVFTTCVLTVPNVVLKSVIVAFPGHTHLRFDRWLKTKCKRVWRLQCVSLLYCLEWEISVVVILV